MTEPTLYPVEPDVLRYKLTKALPYFSDVIYRLRPRPTKGLATFGIDKNYNWYFDPEGVPFDPDQQITVLYHEINHAIRNHHGREGDRDPKKWNIAGDREINDWFPNGFKIPDGGIGSKKYNMDPLDLPDDELAEWYFDRLDQYEVHVREDATPMSPGTGACESHKDQKCDSKDVDVTWGPNHTIKEKGVIHAPICGGVAGHGDPDKEGDGYGDADGVSEIEAEAIRQNVAEKVAKEAAKGRGNIPGSLAAWAESILNPVVPWQKILRTVARKASTIIAGDTEQTYTRASRRSPRSVMLPKKIARKTTAAFYIDTSGSVSDEEVSQGIAEVKAALRTNLADMTISFVDAEVYETIKATNGHYRKPKGLQRGGTDMKKCFEHADKLQPRPNLIIVMTDGETPWPPDPLHGTRTIIVLTRDGGSDYFKPPEWAFKIITMDRRS